jgi:hypothetical protein
MAGGFKRSGVFGIVGVFVVAAIVVAIATTTGEGQANPKTTYALIFGVIAAFLIVLFALQRADIERVAGSDAKAVQRAVAEGSGRIEDPTAMSEQQLWASLAVKPIGDEAIRARSQMWESSRRSWKLAVVVCLLIMLTVPSIYLFESFVPLLIGGPLIALAAAFGSIRALMPGGEMDSAYERVGVAMAPLGLEVTEKPKVNIEVREATTGRVGPRVHGVLGLSGERHGRRVEMRIGEGSSEVTVRAPAPEFRAKSRDGRVRAGDGAPDGIVTTLAEVPNSARWKKLTAEGGSGGIVITRKGAGQADWLCDLWLAERLAEASA